MEKINIIDFRVLTTNENVTDFVIQPNYKIQYENINIELNGESFDVNIGCQHQTITRDNIMNIIFEFEGIVKKPKIFQLILPNGDKRDLKSAKNLPIYKESSPSLYISTNGKTYDKEKFSIISKTMVPSNEFFKKSDITNTVIWLKNERKLYNTDVLNTKKMLKTMCAHYGIQYPENEQTNY